MKSHILYITTLKNIYAIRAQERHVGELIHALIAQEFARLNNGANRNEDKTISDLQSLLPLEIAEDSAAILNKNRMDKGNYIPAMIGPSFGGADLEEHSLAINEAIEA